MCKVREFIIKNEMGIHARPATHFVTTTVDYESEVYVTNLDSGHVADGRSIISMLMLCAPKGTRLKLEVNGKDEEELFTKLSTLIDNGFNELT